MIVSCEVRVAVLNKWESMCNGMVLHMRIQTHFTIYLIT